MTSEEQIRGLERLGWIYDPRTDKFHNGSREAEWKDLIGLVPRLTSDDLKDDER
jgi:hypothetical protein